LSRPIDDAGGVRFDPAAGLLGMLAGVGRQIDAPMAAYQELIPAGDMDLEALGTAGVATLGGGAVTRPSGSFGANSLRVYHGTDANIDRLDSSYARTARDLYTTPIRDDAAMYGRNVLEFDVSGNIGDFRPESRTRDAVQIMRKVYSEHGLSDYFDNLDDFISAFDSGDLYQRFANSQVQDDIVAGLLDEGGFDAVRIPDAGFGGSMSESVVARSPDIFAPVVKAPDQPPPSISSGPQNDVGFFNFPFDEVSANAAPEAGLLSAAAARTPAEQMARQILDMRAAGRAGDVTDEMMAAADPQYMFANTPLPMDEASRLARAGEMGFEEQYYKGMYPYDSNTGEVKDWRGNVIERVGELPVEIQTIDNPSLFPTFNRADRAEPGYKIAGVMGRDVDVANRFASWPDSAVYPLQTRAGRVYDVDAAGGSAASTHFFEEGRPFRDAMRSGQYDTGVIRNTADEGDIAFALDPRNIRSRFARFDPEFAHLSNLNAANIDPMAGLFGAMAAEEQRRQRNAP